MGQAKQRGTYEERRSLAVAKRREEVKAEKTTPFPRGPIPRGPLTTGLYLAMWAAFAQRERKPSPWAKNIPDEMRRR